MKIRYPKFLFPLLLIVSTGISSQDIQPVRFAKGDFIPTNNISQKGFSKSSLSKHLFEGKYFVIVQFSILPSKQTRQLLKTAGVELGAYLPGRAYLATISAGFDFSRAGSFNIRSVDALPPSYKIDSSENVYQGARGKEPVNNIAVGYFPGLDKRYVVQKLQEAGAVVVITKYDAAGIVFIQPGSFIIQQVAALPFVSSLQSQSITDKPLNYKNAGAHGITGLNSVSGKNLNGRGITIGIGDNADISSHIDFAGRLINRSPVMPADHGTHVAGTAAGAGIIDPRNRGVASGALVINQYFSDIITNAPAYIIDNRMVVTNNSYHTSDVGCPGNGRYDALSNYADQQLTDHPQLLHVVAAGNDGTYSCSSLPPGFGTIKSGWQAAKNVLTVGAINTDDYGVAYFSSRGPVGDGRLKPEITAGGWAVLSTNSNNTYGLNSGTSMSAPVVSGMVALMYERYRQKFAGTDPSSSLVKALACNTAEDLGNPGPDYTFGFGMINARRAVEAIDSNRYIINAVADGANGVHTIPVPVNTRRLKVMLYWADPAAAVNAAGALVNDLDLTVTSLSVLHRPLVLSPVSGNVSSVAAEGADHTNNIEQVVIDNPSAGNYTIRVNGFAVPAGPQEYIVSYETDRRSVTVEYPFGGEKLVPGEVENIRWTAYGDEANSFSVAYSHNNGATWKMINNNVSASARTIAWIVPDTVTSAGLIRVSRNGTSLTGQTNSPFMVLATPVLTATNICQGAVGLNWRRVKGATSYDVLQLYGDSMKLIANVADTNFNVKSLDRSEKAWFGVAARNGSYSGRRSVSKGIVPDSGPCTSATFNNDLKVDTILEPTSARKGYINEAATTRPVRIVVRNTGSIPVSGPFNISFSYAGTTVTEVFGATIPARGTYIYTFTRTYQIIASGYRYDLKSWITLATDANHGNDTAYKTVRYINNDPITTLPLTEGFESMPANDFTAREMAIGNNRYIDFSASSLRGRARTFVNTGFARSGSKALTLDQAPYSDSTTTDSITLSYNLINFSAKQLRFDFFYKNHGQAAAPGNKVLLRGSENDQWVQAWDLFARQGSPGQWTHGNINISEVLGNAVPPQTISPTFQMKILQEGRTSANSAHPLTDIDDGYTFDDLALSEALNDVGLLEIISPATGDCSLTASNPVSIKIRNYNNAILHNVLVSFRVNGGVVITETIPSLAPKQTMDYVFFQKANLSAYIDHTIDAWVRYAADNYTTNDSVLNVVVHNSPVISTYPYLQSFEVNDGFFYTRGTNNSWAHGTPGKRLINKAANGNKAWVTGLAENYKNNEASYLHSPCFNLGGLIEPMLSFSHILELERAYDYAWVEYSTNGLEWRKLGNIGAGTNWYDTTINTWSISRTGWHVASVPLPAGSSGIRFRFVLSTDGGVTEEGIGIDDIHVYDRAAIYDGTPITATQSVSGNSWVHFQAAGERIASINPGGINLGSTVVRVYPFAGPVRNSNNSLYADRNIVVKPANPPNAKVGVRFYFTDREAQALINATGCESCTRVPDPYELGIAKYHGNQQDENGSLDDDSTGTFQYISADSTMIVPYDNGYYAAFSVNSFSEFWLSTGDIRPAANGACRGETIVFRADQGAGLYQWQQDSGAGFININDNAIYNGTKTGALQLINLPGTFTGYKYRCIKDGIAGPAFTVRFKNSWNGATNTNWFLASNWSCGTLPDQYTDVVIPGGLVNYPVVNASALIRKLSVQPGARITIETSIKLDITGK